MKKKIFTLLAAVAALTMNAQDITNPVIETFEDENLTLSNISYEGGAVVTIENNPYTTGINKSEKCLQIATGADHQWWHKIHLKPADGVFIQASTKSHVYFHFKCLRTRVGENSEVWLLDPSCSEATKLAQVQFNNTQAGVWEDFVIDITDAVAEDKKICDIRIQPELNFNNAVSETTYLFDDFYLLETSYPDGVEIKSISNIVNFDDEALTAENVRDITVIEGEGASCAIVDNPLPASLVNLTERVVSYNKPANATWWHAMKININGLIKVEYPHTYLHVAYQSPDGSACQVIVKDHMGRQVRSVLPPYDAGEWEDFVIDLSEDGMNSIQAIEFLFGYTIEENWANPAGTFYVDEIMLNDDFIPRETISGVKKTIDKAGNLVSYVGNGVLCLSAKGLTSAEVYGVSGAKVAEAQAAGEVTFGLPQGLYVVKAVVDGKTIVNKVVVR